MPAFWPALDVVHRGARREGRVLVVDRDRPITRDRPVVVPGGELRQPGLEHVLLDPPVEPDELGVVVLHHLDRAGEPVLQEGLAGPNLLALGGAVEVGVRRIGHVGVEAHPAVEEEPVLGPVARRADHHGLRPYGVGQLAHDVSPGAHGGRVPAGQCRVVHDEPVVMLADRHHELGAGPTEQGGPVDGVEGSAGEVGDEVLVAELVLRPERLAVMAKDVRPLPVHLPRIPLVAVAGHAVGAPVDEDPELAVGVPGGHLVAAAQAVPVGTERPGGDPRLDLEQDPVPGALDCGWIGRRRRHSSSFIGALWPS